MSFFSFFIYILVFSFQRISRHIISRRSNVYCISSTFKLKFVGESKKKIRMALRRETRLRKEFLYKKQQDIQNSTRSEKKRVLKEALENGTYIYLLHP